MSYLRPIFIAVTSGLGFSNANTNGTGNSIADFLLGIPSRLSQSTGNILFPRQKAYYFYGMDDWKPRPNLILQFLHPPLIRGSSPFIEPTTRTFLLEVLKVLTPARKSE